MFLSVDANLLLRWICTKKNKKPNVVFKEGFKINLLDSKVKQLWFQLSCKEIYSCATTLIATAKNMSANP